jgi:dTDP-4-dehydrorhamnose reductase
MKEKKVLIVGSTGCIGKALSKLLALNSNYAVIATSRKNRKENYYLDLNSDCKTWPMLGLFEIIVYLPSMDGIQSCEINLVASEFMHCIAMKKIYNQYALTGCQLIIVSTQRVFSGDRPFLDEFAKPDPTTIYGAHKAMAEKLVQKYRGVAIRATKILSDSDVRLTSFVNRLLKGEQVIASTQVNVSLVPVNKIASAIELVMKNKKKGVFQISGSDQLSYYEVALLISQYFNTDHSLVVKQQEDCIGDTKSYFCTLKTSSFFVENGISPVQGRDAIKKWCNQFALRNSLKLNVSIQTQEG